MGLDFIKSKDILDGDYMPSDNEPFMNKRQVDYFKLKLLHWKKSILSESKDTIKGMKAETRNIPDVADRASEETDRALELRTRDEVRSSPEGDIIEGADLPFEEDKNED